MSAQAKQSHLTGLATVLKDILDKRLSQGNITYSKEPEMGERDIIEYGSRMRTAGMEKFNAPCFLSYVNFFVSEAHMKENDAMGALIVYFDVQSANKTLKALGYPIKLDVEDEVVMQRSGEFVRSIAEQLKTELSSRGYSSLMIGDPHNYQNFVPEGIPFSYNEYKSYEINFFAWKEKILSVDLTMAPS